VSVEVVAGPLAYSIEDASLDPVIYSEQDRTTSGTLQIHVNGNGNVGGWQLTIQATGDFAYVGNAEQADTIPANNLSLTSTNAPAHAAGQPIDNTHGPVATGNTGSLWAGLPVATSAAGYGSGSYSQALGVNLVIPAYAPVGTYTGIVTVMASAAPGFE
jgi:hypothetical protein